MVVYSKSICGVLQATGFGPTTIVAVSQKSQLPEGKHGVFRIGLLLRIIQS